jgi:glycerophosphoryl diester phosphodiesterase
MKILIGGHRGLGTTDNQHARSLSVSHSKPAENTVASIQTALEAGADLIEIDTVKTLDEQVVVIHSNRLSDHVFNVPDLKYVGDYTLKELKQFRVGPRQDGVIPTLQEVIDCIDHFNQIQNSNVQLNIEIKDLKNTPTKKFIDGKPTLLDLLVDYVKGHEDWIMFSSFAIADLIVAQSMMPTIRRAMLFGTASSLEQFIYLNDNTELSRYTTFTPNNIKAVSKRVKLHYLHPELHTITEETVALAKELGLGVNVWTWLENIPQEEKPLILNFIRLLKKYNVEGGIMTDHLVEMRHLINSECRIQNNIVE